MYIALLFAPDGDFTTDFRSETKDEVLNKLSDMGSKWLFYPFITVIKTNNINGFSWDDHKYNRVLETNDTPTLQGLKNHSLQTFRNLIKKIGAELLEDF